MDITILFIVYRWNLGMLDDKAMAIRLSKVAKLVRDAGDRADKELCRMFIKTVSARKYKLAIEALRFGEVSQMFETA